MNILTVVVGGIMLLYGTYVLVTRARLPANKIRLQFFREYLGRPAGLLVFSMVYVILPIGVGLFLIVQGMHGVPMGDLLGPQSPQ